MSIERFKNNQIPDGRTSAYGLDVSQECRRPDPMGLLLSVSTSCPAGDSNSCAPKQEYGALA
jgi:hypothetical protein